MSQCSRSGCVNQAPNHLYLDGADFNFGQLCVQCTFLYMKARDVEPVYVGRERVLNALRILRLRSRSGRTFLDIYQKLDEERRALDLAMAAWIMQWLQGGSSGTEQA